MQSCLLHSAAAPLHARPAFLQQRWVPSCSAGSMLATLMLIGLVLVVKLG
jgi:hypothetical protein